MAIVLVIIWGFIIGGLARWAVPGPDPMPFWLTVLIGCTGSWIAAGIAALAYGHLRNPSREEYFVVFITSIVAAMVLVVLYRRFIQKRPIVGPEAYSFPTRGFGIDRMRRRLAPRLSKQEVLDHLDELHDKGLLTDDEYIAKRREVIRQG
jgi:uncharacterized membrane protein YeaQ/YmgE (transglycosylase-associated protein family)